MPSRRTSVTQEARHLATEAATLFVRRLENYGLVRPPGRRPAALPHAAIVAMPARGEILFRLLYGDEVERRDFLSNYEKHRPAMRDEDHLLRCGVSMFEHPDQALLRANRYPLAVAAVTLGAGLGVTLAKTFGAGHYTVWGDPDTLAAQAQLSAVVDD